MPKLFFRVAGLFVALILGVVVSQPLQAADDDNFMLSVYSIVNTTDDPRKVLYFDIANTATATEVVNIRLEYRWNSDVDPNPELELGDGTEVLPNNDCDGGTCTFNYAQQVGSKSYLPFAFFIELPENVSNFDLLELRVNEDALVYTLLQPFSQIDVETTLKGTMALLPMHYSEANRTCEAKERCWLKTSMRSSEPQMYQSMAYQSDCIDTTELPSFITQPVLFAETVSAVDFTFVTDISDCEITTLMHAAGETYSIHLLVETNSSLFYPRNVELLSSEHWLQSDHDGVVSLIYRETRLVTWSLPELTYLLRGHGILGKGESLHYQYQRYYIISPDDVVTRELLIASPGYGQFSMCSLSPSGLPDANCLKLVYLVWGEDKIEFEVEVSEERG